MLRIYHSNALDTLRDILVEMIKNDPQSDPFLADQILVQSPGMAQWLKLELAERLGIAANIEFPLPASFLWKVFVAALDDVPERSAYNKASMTWVLMRILPEHLNDDLFSILRQYLKQDDDPLRLYHLCAKVADLYDQYLVYRPDWIAAWEQGDDQPADDQEQRWQPVLWRAIVADTSARGLPHWHRANMYDTFISALSDKSSVLSGVPQRIFVFGISALPQNYIEALAALGEKIDVHLMLANPCRHYWGDIVDPAYLARLNRLWLSKGQDADSTYQTGHPLLASMGKLGRDYLYLIQQMELPEVGLFNDACYDLMLSALQSDILELNNRGSVLEHLHQDPDLMPISFAADDQSIQLHSAHSALREVEILQDQLLAMFNDNATLKPRDIIVMMPDVAHYAPYIDAVFGNAEQKCFLPYSISDRSAEQEIPLLSSFMQLIALNNSRFSVSEVIALLELPATLRRFGLEQEDFENIRHWIHETGIHWGLDQASREDVGSVQFEQNSWHFGMDRLFSGYALGAADTVWNDIAPYDGVGGLSAAALGQLSAFLTQLGQLKELFSGEQSLTEWIVQIHQMMDSMYLPDERDHEALELIYQALESLRETFQEVTFEGSIDVAILRDYLQEQLSSQRSSQRFLSGQINFCTLIPMRAIPFKVVCLLGMNDSDYPRSLPPMGFDLMVDHPRKGDRSRRDDDRYLFLEALLSARETLYISYVGRSIADNSKRVPSVLVSEVLEYCDQAYRIEGLALLVQQHLLLEHPLTAYSPAYFDASSERLFSYNARWAIPQAEAAQVARGQAENFIKGKLQETECEQLELEELIMFYRHPIQYFFQKRMQIYFRDDELVLSDEEPFHLEPLTDYHLRKRLLKSALRGDGLEATGQYIRQSGVLPVGKAGDIELFKRTRDIGELYEKMQPLMTGEPRRLEIKLRFPGLGKLSGSGKLSESGNCGSTEMEACDLTLQGWVNDAYQGGVLKYDVSKVSGRHRFITWIQHLATCAAGFAERTIYRGLSEQFSFKPVSAELAHQELTQLISVYREGQRLPLNWIPEPAWKWLSLREKDEDRARKDAQSRFESDRGGDGSNPYVRRVYPEWRMLESGVFAYSDQLFSEMMNYLEVDKDDN
ncbi:exodeoxyribonuclease V subunit gamma [Neptunomonas antarctica]|uniref:RecBCD enzyme subunit RecC n=1 Tax=Neptunomonas antarctica TaxID=619304 RepID=A0A1N7NP69_9GAMM|nr:exodeoxyribonuclease V subunit gamma [Neptunomonas antarctica]SIT00107.1 DNA helicase/exodeoxyribonuclease V, gamma subunit [Neptunomonas antarctica]